MDDKAPDTQNELSQSSESQSPPKVGPPPKYLLLPFFSSNGEVQDAAVMLALNDKSLEEELNIISAYYKEKKDDVVAFYDPRIRSIQEMVAIREAWLKAKESEQSSLKQDLENGKKLVADLTIQIKEAKTKRQLAWQHILKERFERVRNFFREREARILGELNESRKEIMNNADNQINYLTKFYKLVLDNRKEHAQDLDERVKECAERQKEIKDQLDVAQKEAKRLQEIGITDFSATFLLMFGVFALAGAGSAAANLLSNRQPGNSLFAVILGEVLNAFHDFPAPWGSIMKVVVLLFAPILGIILLYGIFVTFVKKATHLASQYDPSWDAAKSRPNRKTTAGSEWGGTPIINYIKSLTNQFPGMDGFAGDRKTYAQRIAYFPYLMLVVVGLFLFSGIAVDGANVNLTVIVIGMALALLSATSALLYVNYIIEPRWRAATEKYNSEKPSKGFFLRYIVLNLEFFVLLFLLVVALLFAAFLPSPIGAESQQLSSARIAGLVIEGFSSPFGTTGQYFSGGQVKYISWGLVTIFMLLASFGLAYGIVQKGIFYEVKELLRKHKNFQNCIERYKYLPLIENEDYPEPPGLENSLSTFIDRQNNLEELRASYELGHIFTPEEEATIVEKQRRISWPKWLRRFVRFLLAKEKTVLDEAGIPSVDLSAMSLRPVDYLDSKGAVEDYELSELELNYSEEKQRTTKEMITNLQESLKELESEIRKLVEDIENFKAQSVETEEQMRATMAEVNSNFRRDELEFKKAFSVGQQLRKSIVNEQNAEQERPL